MTKSSNPTPRNAQVWRVEFRDRFTYRVMDYAERTGPSFPNGFPRWGFVGAKGPMGLFTATEAKRIATAWNKPAGTRHRTVAKAVKDETAASEQSPRMMAGETV